MKILHYMPVYAPAWQFGGPVRSVSVLCEGLVRLGCEVEVVTTNAGLDGCGEFVPGEKTVRNGVKVTYFPTVPGYGISSPRAVADVREKLSGADILHVTGVWQPTATPVCRAAARAHKPYVISPRGALSAYSWGAGHFKKLLYYWLAERRNIREASGVHYTSEMEMCECAHYRLAGLPCVIPNGLDFSQWRRDEAGGRSWRDRLGLAANTRIAIYSGRVHHKKNLDLLLPALREVPGWVLVIAGFDEGGETSRFLARAESAGVSKKILLTGNLDQPALRAAYSGSDAFVLPSHHENFANAALEAAACGCPLMLSDQVGLAGELEGHIGAHVLSLDPALWTRALREYCTPSTTSHGNVHALESRFSMEQTAKDMLAFYKRVKFQ